MSSGIYLIRDDEQLVEMREAPYDSESVLQTLLAKYPSLLAGDQVNHGQPRRWLLVGQEIGVPKDDAGRDWWAVDHLFLDQDGVPTIVEVKRSSDTRIRREVVGQMLDYAANAVAYWPVDRLRGLVDSGDPANGDRRLADAFGPEVDTAGFWEQVKINLQAGRIRLVFVADVIPSELRRIVEFLNEQMDPAEVIALEVRQFVGEGLKTLVPRVIGQSAEAQQRKGQSRPEARQWDEASFFADLERGASPGAVAAARRIQQWAKDKGTRIWWGKGTANGSFVPVLDSAIGKHYTVAVWSSGSVEVYFQHQATRPPFDDIEKRREFWRRLNAIPGVALPEDSLDRRPSFSLECVADQKNLAMLIAALDWVYSLQREAIAEHS